MKVENFSRVIVIQVSEKNDANPTFRNEVLMTVQESFDINP